MTNIFLFDCFGEVIHTGINFFGSWNDAKIAAVPRLIYPKLGDKMTPLGNALLGDSIFVARTGT